MRLNQTTRLIISLKYFLYEIFNLEEDKAHENEIIENVKKQIEFKGTNLWVLMFAILIASIGLNVNSTAVIIGAMLISPLMGPIMGIGLGVGIFDFELIKKSYKNFGIAVIISLITSSLYFLITPLNEAKSELLARTTPTIWDVFIALFGGLAGIVAATRKTISNVIPGVAIATALMPPLCTAGYGLATGQISFFAGALYLFFINSVFISVATYVMVRFLKFHKKEFIDPIKELRVKRTIAIIVLITIIPSIVIAYSIVQKVVLERNINNFIANELSFPDTEILTKKILRDSNKIKVEILLLGNNINSELIDIAKSKLPKYGLENIDLLIKQTSIGNNEIDLSKIRTEIIEDLYRKNEELIKTKDRQIQFLEKQLSFYLEKQYPIESISKEAQILFGNIKELSLNHSLVMNLINNQLDTTVICYVNFLRSPGNKDRLKFINWLKARIETEKLKVIIENK